VPREHARYGARSLRTIVEERRRPVEPAHPPVEQLRRAAGEEPERRRRWRLRRERPDGGAFVDAAERRAEYRVPRAVVGLVVHEGMNHADDREARPGGGVAPHASPGWIARGRHPTFLFSTTAPSAVASHDTSTVRGRHVKIYIMYVYIYIFQVYIDPKSVNAVGTENVGIDGSPSASARPMHTSAAVLLA
jgi:hypothetical protein